MQMQLHVQVLTKAATHAEAIADAAADEDVDAMLESLGRVRLSSGRRHVHLFCADTWSRTPVGKWLGGLTGLASSRDGYASRWVAAPSAMREAMVTWPLLVLPSEDGTWDRRIYRCFLLAWLGGARSLVLTLLAVCRNSGGDLLPLLVPV